MATQNQPDNSFFALLRQHIADEPCAIASRSSRRTVTYRKFWSRIERATARLIGEWGVRAGDTVAYFGCGHQDALMLYIAVARCGAKLLPLERAPLQQDVTAILERFPAAVLLHDDDIAFDLTPPVRIVTTLSSLIATRCHHKPVVEEDDRLPSLILPGGLDDGAEAVPESEHSLHALYSHQAVACASEFPVVDTLFDMNVLVAGVLPTLTARGTIVFR